MAEQETLPSGGARTTQGGIWRRYLLDDGTINHAAWLRAHAEGALVGSCRMCANGHLAPRQPHDRGEDRGYDYEASCVDCHHTYAAPGGRTLARSSRTGERPHNRGNR